MIVNYNSAACRYPQLQWMRLETLLSLLNVPVVTWRWSRLSSTIIMLIQRVSVYQWCYVVDGGLPQSQSTRLVTPHSLWPVLMATWTQSSILWMSIIMILEVSCMAQLLLMISTPEYTEPVNKAGDTPLSLAYKGGHWEVVKYLAITHHCDTTSNF